MDNYWGGSPLGSENITSPNRRRGGSESETNNSRVRACGQTRALGVLGYVKREQGGKKAEELNGFAGESEMKRISIMFKNGKQRIRASRVKSSRTKESKMFIGRHEKT